MNASLAAFLFWISVAVCAVAELAIVGATARASRRAAASGAEQADVPQVEGARPLPAPRRWLEVVYAAAPAVVLALLFVFTWRAMHVAQPDARASAETVPSPVSPLVAGPIPNR